MSQEVFSHKKFGTFIGVFVPSVLTILGLIMYLRFGWVLANVGLGFTLAIVLLASSITFITGLSASAIATNMHVGTGGEYYMVSRSLGLELGGSIGIPLYFCRTLSVTFYGFGLAEAAVMFLPELNSVFYGYALQGIAAIIIIFITLLSGKSAEIILKVQIPFFIFVMLSLLVLMAGTFSGDLKSPSFEANYGSAPEGFWYVFAVFFPAVTGFTAGIGMSGDLKDPKNSIPRGTIGAVLFCLVIYLLIPVVISFSGKVTNEQLLDAGQGIQNWINISLFGGIIIIPAVLGAILSSAFGSILGGPRVLQALSNDKLAPEIFSRVSKTGQPTMATWGTGLIALLAVLLGGLNTVAVLVSVLFLTLYVAINVSAAIEVIVAEPHYRPRIAVPWWLSLLGAAAAIFVMFLISPWACLIALLFEIAIYSYLGRKSLAQKWGDVGSGLLLNIAKRALLNHSRKPSNPRNWRPQILLFNPNVKERKALVRLAAAIAESKGVLTICRMVAIENYESPATISDQLYTMQQDLRELGIEGFCEVIVVKDLAQGSLEIAKAHGIAGLKSNTVMEGVSVNPEARAAQLGKLRMMAGYGKNIIYARINEIADEEIDDSIRIWWGGRENNADLMILLAYLMRLYPIYKKTHINIISIVKTEEDKDKLESQIKRQMSFARITADVHIILSQKDPMDIIPESSSNSRITMIGLPLSGKKSEEFLAQWITTMSDRLPLTLFVYNAGMADAIPSFLKPE